LRERPLLTMKDMGMDMPGMDMKGMKMRDHANAQVKMGPGVEMINPMPMDRTGDPGIGLDGSASRADLSRSCRARPIPICARPNARSRFT
jgi:hypothetical protein